MTSESGNDLLARLRRALLSGDIAALTALTTALEACFLRDPPPADAIGILQENRRLLAAAQRGIGAARQRLADIHSARACPTYDTGGRRALHPGPRRPPHRA